MEILDEHTELYLLSVGADRFAVLKIVRELTGLGLKEAKALLESAPVLLKAGMASEDARRAQRNLGFVGAEASTKWAGS